MSDPMTNVQIEDVLSSIRRLVSEDHRPAPRLTLEMAVSPGKLVLTPALRIVSDDHGTAAAVPPEPATFTVDPVSHQAAAAVLEAVVSHRTDDWEPDGSEVAASDWTLEWEADDAAQPVTASLPTADAVTLPRDTAPALPVESQLPEAEALSWSDAAGPVDTAFGTGAADEVLSGIEDTLVDEEALRDLVREILREELQGSIGERMTRNVRKLVRAEINRALAAREFD